MAEKHFEEQKLFARDYLVPLLEKSIPDFRKKKILEVGCAEGGLLDYLQSLGIACEGIELEAQRVALAKKLNPELTIWVGDITDPGILQQISNRFDVVVMRDVIEHITRRSEAFRVIAGLLETGGYLFITFPPRFSAFAGHQQHAQSFLKLTPFVHLLPKSLWRWLGEKLGETPEYLNSVMHNYKIGLTIHKFEHLFPEAGFKSVVRDVFLLRPIFKFRMGLPTIKFPNIPVTREIFATGCEYLLRKTA